MAKTKIPVSEQEKARRAVSAFRRLQPVLNSYARNLTGRKDIRVQVAANDNGSTDGKTIFYRPPIELGDDTPHVRAVCNRRGDNLQLICPACNLREDVLSTIFHEIAHIWFASFAGVSEYHQELALQQIVRERGTKYADRIVEQFKVTGWPKGFMQLASTINEFFPFLINCLEDARVNRELFKALPGTEVMFKANVNHVFSDGVQQLIDGEWARKEWRDYPLNPQVMLGTFCIASGYDYKDWFAPVVEKALNDPILGHLVYQSSAMVSSPGDVFKMAFPVLERLRELGFCKNEYEPEVEPEEEEENGEDEAIEGEQQSEGEAEASEEASEGDGDDGSGEGTSADEEGSESELESGVSSQGDEGSSGSSGGSGNDSMDRGHSEDDGDPEVLDSGEAGTASDTQPDSSDLGDEQSEGGVDQSSGSDNPGREDASASPGELEGNSGISSGSESGNHEPSELTDDGSDLPMGTPEEVRIALARFGDHEEVPDSIQTDIEVGEKAVDFVIIQGMYFETPPAHVHGVRIYDHDKHEGEGWFKYEGRSYINYLEDYGVTGDFSPDESVVAPALLKARVAFAANNRGKVEINARKGKIRPSALGRRAPVNDDRMFQRKTLPGKKSYHVVIGLDISGSTVGENIVLTKQMAMVEAEMLSRLGISFEMWAHSANYDPYLELYMYQLKTADEPWNQKTLARLTALGPDAANLDGHALSFLRRQAGKSTAQTKIIHYVSDGAMPAENHDEELEVLQREIKTCKKLGYILTGIGIRCNSPEEHGLETVEVHEKKDIEKVISNLQKKITRGLA